ncbi:hypothetical protein [Caulobacter sp. NIBR2454]|uniref:hypothetical protein n=1 Tax=Caulobacter sp. NIBR2454 TaxID=3015996 RepID=UPI0022B748F3|nr:hypothetical protein [Caulobacter sp. NIBR2454]
MRRLWGLLAMVGAVSLPLGVLAQVMEEEQAAPRSASVTAAAPRAPGEEAEQSAAGAAPSASLSNFLTPWPADAPQTVKGAAMAQAVEQLRARFTDPAWTPQKTMVHGAVITMPPKVVKACGALHDFRMTTSGPPHHIKEYRGAAKWCGFHPHNAPAKVAGLILYADGSYWLGEVSGTTVSHMPMPSGAGEAGYPNGMRVLGVASPTLASDKGLGVRDFGFSTTERVIFSNGAMRAASLDASGAGNGEMRWPDGRVFRGDFKDRKPSAGDLTFPSGARVNSLFSSNTEGQPPAFQGQLYLDLAKADGAFPAGTYRVSPPSALTNYRSLLTVNAIPTRETLTRAPSLPPECPAPSVVPAGWIPWGGGCRSGENSRVAVYSPDARSFIEEQPNSDMPLRLVSLSPNGEVRRIVRAKALTAAASPAPVGEAELLGEGNRVLYRGEFLGQSPNGPGICATPQAEGGGEEPCFYAEGRRTDEIQLARREAAEAARQLRLAEAAAQREANARAEAQRQADAERARAQEQAYQAQRDYERQMARAQEEEDEDSGSGVNPIYQAMQELQGKFASAAVDMQNQRAETDAMRRNIEAQYRARQAELNRQQAQRNAEAAQQNAARNQQNADAARRAEIARQEAARAAQARADSLRAARERQQAALAQAQLQQRQAASSIGGSSISSSAPGGSASSSKPRSGAGPTILTFTNNYGWKVGDNSNTQNAQGISVSFTVASSTIADRMYYKARFCDAGSGAWEGGMRLTATYPDRTHATIRVPQGGCTGWSDHLIANAKNIYILVDKNDD